MGRVYESVEQEIGKYQDISTILKKLAENNIYEDLCEIFQNIHRKESLFTVTELKRISENKSNNIDLVEQFWVNSDIFRSNLILIVTSLINGIWNNEELARNYIEGEDIFDGNISSQLKNRVNSNANGASNYNSNRPDYFGHNSKRAQADRNVNAASSNKKTTSIGKKQRPKSVGKDKPFGQGSEPMERNNLKQRGVAIEKVSGRNNNNFNDVNYDQQQYDDNLGEYDHLDVNYNNRIRSKSKNSRSKSRSPDIDEDQYGDNWNNRSMTKSCSNINSVYTKILNSTQSNKVKKLIGEKNSDLDSEFQFREVGGPSFSKARKGLQMVSPDAPAPGAYHVMDAKKAIESSVKNVSKFGKDKKAFWMDKQLNTNTPGPIYRPSKHFASK